ncbi:transposase [Catenisphaera adipataccumulans]|jgi:transposase|uniref:Transposase n=1 Tax=Catenisphaera adipataccumulans TaxID=700500 RepID=A0A7W8FXD2_9FIRM|nr:transposase [Catenisphaera adipataccumulans]
MPVRGRPSRQKVELKTYIQALENQLEDLQMTEGIVQFAELSKKIARHRKNILNSVELQVNSSRSEAANTTIKSLIATTRGFRNLDNMFALIYRDVQT